MNQNKHFIKFGFYETPDKYLHLQKLSLKELIEKLCEGMKQEPEYECHYPSFKDKESEQVYFEFLSRMNLVRYEEINDMIKERFSYLDKRLTDLNSQYINHRHDASKHYTEKPVY